MCESHSTPRESMLKISAAIFACSICVVSPAQTRPHPLPNAPDRGTPQTISFAAVPAQTAKSVIALSATTSSRLPVNLYPTTPTVCSVSGSIVTLHAAGTCVIRANQAGDKVFAAAPMVTQSFLVDSTSSPNLFDIARAGNVRQQAYPPPPSQFSSSCPRPTIVSVSPYFWPSGGTYQVTIKGSGFTSPENAAESCPVPWFTAQSDADSATLLNVTVVNSTTAVATVAVSTTGGGQALIQVWYPPPPGDDGPTATAGAKR